MSDVTGLDGLYKELNWIAGGMDADISKVINEVTAEGHNEMAHSLMPIDTGYMSSTTEYSLGFMSGKIFNISTGYSLFVDGTIPIVSRPYTTTPFIQPTLDFINSGLDDKILKVVSAMRR